MTTRVGSMMGLTTDNMMMGSRGRIRTISNNSTSSAAPMSDTVTNSGDHGNQDAMLNHKDTSPKPRLHDDDVSARAALRDRIFKTVILYTGVFVLGLQWGIIGPSLPDLEQLTESSTTYIALILTGRNIASLVGSALAGFLIDRYNNWLLLGSAEMLLGLLFALSPWTQELIILAVCLIPSGMAAGFYDTGVNVAVMRIWISKPAPWIQAMECIDAVGSFMAPLLTQPFLAQKATNPWIEGTESEFIQNDSLTHQFLVDETTITSKHASVDGRREGGAVNYISSAASRKLNDSNPVSQLLNESNPVSRLWNNSDPARLWNDSDPARLWNDSDPARLWNDSDPARLWNDSDPARLWNDSDPARLWNDSDPARLWNDSDPARLWNNSDNARLWNNSNLDHEDVMLMHDSHQHTRVMFAYLIVGILLMLVATAHLVIFCRDRRHSVRDVSATRSKAKDVPEHAAERKIRLLILPQLFLICFAYYALETGYAHYLMMFCVKHLSWTKNQGVAVTSAFWGAYTSGTVIGIIIVKYVRPRTLLIFDIVLCMTSQVTLACFLSYHPAVVWFCTIATGFGIATIFASVFSWTQKNIGISGKVNALLMVGMATGEMTSPALIGILIDKSGAISWVYCMVAAAAVCTVSFVMMHTLADKLKRVQKQHQIYADKELTTANIMLKIGDELEATEELIA